MGAGISSNTGNCVETILENRKIALDGQNRVFLNGEEYELPLRKAQSGVLSSNRGEKVKARTLTLEGECDSKISWYFPGKDPAELYLLKEQRTGDWKHQGDFSGEVTASFFTALFRHGKNPEGAEYAYLILPGMDSKQAVEFAKNPTIEVLQNDERAAAVLDKENSIIAVNFWQPGTVAGMECDTPASVVLLKSKDRVAVAVADPTQRNRKIRLILPFEVRSVKKARCQCASDQSGA
ncbi:protein containing Polysaccharide lyase family 8 [gut metagenome]|uniref:Protein containing Polysaccharide lyase family 8 n=1 Tax=gut metagenome TaxID=749906 RepID=J9GCK0_9ZZZZ